MENVNDLQVRAFYERLKALSDGGVVVNGLMIVSLSKFEDLLEAYRTYFFDAISDFDDESYHYDSLNESVNFDDLQHKLDNLSNDVKDLDKSLSFDDDSNESEEPEDDVVEESETVDSDEDPVVANAFGVKKDADDELEKEDSKDDANSHSNAVNEKISDSEVKVQSESQLEDTHDEDVMPSLKLENDSFSASKNFDGRFDKVMSSMSKSDADDVVKSSAEVVASDSVSSQESLESLDDIDVPVNSMNDGDIYADSIHVTSNDNDDLNEDEVMDDSDLGVAAMLDAMPDGVDNDSDDKDQ